LGVRVFPRRRRPSSTGSIRLLGDIAAALLTTDSPETAVQHVYGALAEPLRIDACLLYLPGGDGSLLQLHTWAGVPEAIVQQIRTTPPGHSVSHHVVERRRPMIAFALNRSSDPRFDRLREIGLKSYVCYPLLGREYVVGALAFGSRVRHRFEDPDLELVRTIANLTALAIERSQLTQALMASEFTLRTYYESAPVLMGIVELTETDDIIHIYDNPAAQAFLGSAPGGGRASERGMAADTIQLWAEQYRRAESSGAAVRFEYVHETAAGPRWLRAVVTRISATPGRRPRFSYMAEDITDRRFAEESLRDADRRKDEFLAMLAHELRNPLAPIRFALRMLESTSDAGEAARARAVIDRQVSHLVRLVDDLLDVSRITRNKIQLRPDRISVAGVMRAAVESTSPVLSASGHRLEVIEPRPDVIVNADHARMVQVFTNLLNNASKFTPPGGRLVFAAHATDTRVDVSVRDNGAGIEPRLLPYLFQLFQQGPAGREGPQGGLGIGLALARRLVEMHGGSIQAFSEGPGCGAEFRVSLPVMPGDAREVRPTPVHDMPPLPATPMRVLVVDDNVDSADMLAAMVEMLDHEVRVEHDGPRALETARAWAPKVGLLDIGLPGIDGYEVARRLRADPETAAMLLVAITGWGQEDDRRRAREAGFDAHFTKPADPGALRDLLQSYAREDRIRPQTRHEDSRT
jgi:signal transduction histidine kinase/ActR/RegA family two-component response regulator